MNINPGIVKKLDLIKWEYADKDIDALKEIKKRLIETAQNKSHITYSELTEGITFHVSNMYNGEPFQISKDDWTGLNRQFIGNILGYLSRESYKEAGFFISSLAVKASVGDPDNDLQPSVHFFEWMEDLGLISNRNQNTVLEFWVPQLKATYKYYMK